LAGGALGGPWPIRFFRCKSDLTRSAPVLPVGFAAAWPTVSHLTLVGERFRRWSSGALETEQKLLRVADRVVEQSIER